MEFLVGFLVLVASWFGFGVAQVTEVASDPAVLADQATQALEQELVERTGMDLTGVEMPAETDATVNASSTQEAEGL